MTLEVWIASHFGKGNNSRHCQVLFETLNSLAPHSEITKVRLSLSYENANSLPTDEEMADILTDRLICHRHSGTVRQFDHLRYILRNYHGSEEQLVMFMDDDDVLLHLPPELSSGEVRRLQGIQYITRVQILEEDILPYEGWCIVTRNHAHLFDVVNDFSGYTCSVADFRQYNRDRTVIDMSEKLPSLVKSSNLLLNMEDTAFMNYVDSLGPLTPQPFIGHRLWRENSDKDWTQC